MTGPATLLIGALLAAPSAREPCFIVTNHAILSCSASREEIAAASAPGSSTSGSSLSQPGSRAGTAPRGQDQVGEVQRQPGVPGGTANPEQAAAREAPAEGNGGRPAEAAREAEEQRAAQAREASLVELAGIRAEAAAERARAEQAAQARQQVAAQLDGSAVDLLQTQFTLATGTVGDADAALERAAQAFAAAHSRDGSAWVAAAQDALARSDLFAARQALVLASQAAARARATP